MVSERAVSEVLISPNTVCVEVAGEDQANNVDVVPVKGTLKRTCPWAKTSAEGPPAEEKPFFP